MTRVAGRRSSNSRGFALATVALLVLIVVVLTPTIALAHAAVVSSDPEPGSELGATPGVVVLRFTEPLNVKLSIAAVIAPDGNRFEGQVSGDEEIRIPVTTNAQGVYEVTWRTVSTLDGHTLAGTFRFGVGVPPGAGAEGSISSTPRTTDLALAVGRTVEYAALLLALGMFSLARLARREPRLEWVRLRPAPVLAVALVSGIAVVVGEALTASATPSVGDVVTYLTTGVPGVARLARLLFEGIALIAVVGKARPRVAPVVAALVALAAAGHAAAVRPAWWGVTVDSVHLVSAGIWAGGVLALATLRPPGGWRSEPGRTLLDRFTPVALPMFGVTVGAGVLRGVQEVGRLGELFSSSYGQVLLVKVASVVLMTFLSSLAWRRVVGSVRLEGAVVVFVVGAAALLAAFPLPPARVAEAEEALASASTVSALPRPGDLTLGAHAGQVLVGLTLRPATPGPNEILLYLLPLDGEEAASGLRADLSVNDRPVSVERCGPTCRRAEVDLQGRERVSVEVQGSVGGTASFRLPELPAPDAGRIVQGMVDRMHALGTYRLDESLTSGLEPVRAVYAFRAPDMMESTVTGSSGVFRSVFIGPTRYSRQDDGPWKLGQGPALTVPSFIWDYFRPLIDARSMGRAVVDGIPTREIAFFGDNPTTPVWFRMWVDHQGLVRRAEMRAQGHFMSHRYYDFDKPFTIKPPGTPS